MKPVFQENEKSSGYENMSLNMTGSVLPGMWKKNMFDINPKLREIKQNYKKFKLVTNFILCFISNGCEVYVGGY